MRKIYTLFILSVCLVGAGIFSSCDKWLDVKSDQQVFEDEAFKSTTGYRNALIGVYETCASTSLWGQELTWGLLSNVSWNYLRNYSVPKYRQILSSGGYDNDYARTILNNVWSSAYSAIANINNILQSIDDEDASDFEYDFEKNMIIGECKGLRGLLHFQMLELFAPAPITGYTGTAIPYVTTYPDIQPRHLTETEVLDKVLEDLLDAQALLEPIDTKLREESIWQVGTTRMDNMLYVLFWAVGNIHSDGGVRDNGQGDGFFANRGYRLNYWGVTGLLSRVYSYMRDFDNAEKYADIILDNWVNSSEYTLYTSNPPAASNPNRIDTKRLPEPLISFWNNTTVQTYASVCSGTYGRTVALANLFGDDITTDYRYTGLYNTANYHYRVWDGTDANYSSNSSVVNYSHPCLPVLELPELYYIKAECLAQKGDIEGATARLKTIRDARGCTNPISCSSYDDFMSKMVNEAQRDFFTRGTTFCFLKKLNWPTIYNGSTSGFKTTDEWWTMPIPDSETAYY